MRTCRTVKAARENLLHIYAHDRLSIMLSLAQGPEKAPRDWLLTNAQSRASLETKRLLPSLMTTLNS